jgi:hypothetical protein
MVGIDVPGFFPTEFLHGELSSVENALRFGTYEGVFTVGFVPDRDNVNALLREHLERAQLRFGLMSKAIANTEGEPFQF